MGKACQQHMVIKPVLYLTGDTLNLLDACLLNVGDTTSDSSRIAFALYTRSDTINNASDVSIMTKTRAHVFLSPSVASPSGRG